MLEYPFPFGKCGKNSGRGEANLLPTVVVKDGESVEGAIRRFKRKCEKAGVLSELKKRQHYEKPSVKKKKKAIAARKKLLKRLAQERKFNS